MNPELSLSLETKTLLREYLTTMLSLLPSQLGIDEFIPGCRVVDVGAGAYPRTIIVAQRGQEHIYATLRADIGLSVDDIVTVVHIRDGDFYEVYGYGGSSGGGALPVHDHSDGASGGQNLRQILELEFDDAAELTIAGGIITRTQVYHSVDTEGDAASDNLDTINGGTEGDLLIIRPENDARTVVARHNVGNIWFLSGVDVTLDDVEDHILLIYSGSAWCGLGAGGGGGNTLDEAYDQGGAGAGRAITADSGAVDIAQNGLDTQNIELYDTTELTINAGQITKTQDYHRIDTEGDAASDDLDTINGGTNAGELLIIRSENDARTVIVKHNTGNIWLFGEADIRLEDTEDHLALIYDGSMWCSIGDGSGTFVVASGASFPASPSDGELFIRTDLGADGLGRLYRYWSSTGTWYTVSDGRGIERTEIHEHAVNEDKSAECDGAKTDFLTANEFEPETIAIYLNGSRQLLNTDYTEAATYDEITMTAAPNGGDEFIFDYILA